MTLSEMVILEKERIKSANENINRVVSFYQQELKNVGIPSTPTIDSYYPNYSVKLSFGDDACIVVSKTHIFTPYNSFKHTDSQAVLKDIARTIAERNIHAITVGPKKA